MLERNSFDENQYRYEQQPITGKHHQGAFRKAIPDK